MSVHSTTSPLDAELTRLRPGNRLLGLGLMGGGLLLLVIAAALFGFSDTRRFFFAYLFGIAGFTAVSCSALLFVLIGHLVRAGWVVNVRRVLETLAMQLPLITLLMLPVIATVIVKKPILYSWAVPGDTPIVHHGIGHDSDYGDESTPGHSSGGAHGVEHGDHDETGNDSPGKMHPGANPTSTNGGAKANAPTEEHVKAAGSGAGQAAAGHVDASHRTDTGRVLPVPVGDERIASGLNTEDQVSDAEHDGLKVEPLAAAGPSQILYPNEQVQPGVYRAYDKLIAGKTLGWLNPIFWAFRIFLYFALLSGVAWWYFRNSVRQDGRGEIHTSESLMHTAAPLLFFCGLIVTFIAFDVYMSLDPHWFSTMYGVYFFASGTQAMWAIMCLTFILLQKRGYLRASVTTEHFHDMGKWLWAFIFFFAYIAFSQYMLQWYANLPEETFYYDKRGYSTAVKSGYSFLVIILVIGRFAIPFLGLISRHVKRNRFGLGFWAVWLIVCFFVDIYLLILPEYRFAHNISELPFGLPELLCLGGAGLLWGGNVIRTLAGVELRPVRDPRVHESLAYANF